MASTRVLLFGSPGAGKTALLEAGQKVFGPFSSEVTLLDCDGKSALQMLQAEEPFANSSPLKKPILSADAVVLVVDVSAPKKQLGDDFRQSARWLKRLHEMRGRRTDVAALPVYVALTKCDLLARKEDTLETWKKRLEKGKRQYEENLCKYLKQHEPGFGTIKLKVHSSAIKHPALADKVSKSQEPLGVAELFRDCLQSASDFQNRRLTAQSRLQNTIAGLVGLIALLGLLVALLYEFHPLPRGTALDEKVQMTLPKPSATPAERVSGTIKKLEDRKAALDEIVASTGFGNLPAQTRKEVTDYRDEISTYLELQQKSQELLKLPHLAKNDAELKEMEKKVRAFALPDAHAKDWESTRLGKRLHQVVGEYDALQEALKGEEGWLSGQIEKNRKLLIAGNAIIGSLLKGEKDASRQAKEWQLEFQAQVGAQPPTAREENVPGVSRFIYDDLVKFEPARSKHKQWLASREKLRSESATMHEQLNAPS
jgi:GTPase SAR1 family protein